MAQVQPMHTEKLLFFKSICDVNVFFACRAEKKQQEMGKKRNRGERGRESSGISEDSLVSCLAERADREKEAEFVKTHLSAA